MGQSAASDSECVDFLVEQLHVWGEKALAGELTPWNLNQRVKVEGKSFWAELSPIPNYEATDEGPGCWIQVLLHRRGPGRHRPRYLYLRPRPVQRRLSQPRVWRRLGGLRKAEQSGPHRKLSLLQLSRDIYWAAGVPREDLKAQVVIALAQLRLLGDSSPLVQGLIQYLQINFRIPGPAEGRKDISQTVAGDLLAHWSYPEDYRGFRKYVRIMLRVAYGEFHRTFAPLDADRAPRAPVELGTESLSVSETAQSLYLAKTYIYRLAREGRIQTRHDGDRVEIPGSEVERFRRQRAAKRNRQEEIRALRAAGRSYAAARKAIYRRHRFSLDNVAVKYYLSP